MKKLMIAAAAAAMTAGAFAASFLPIDCIGGDPEVSECPDMVFKLTGSGKAVQDVKGEYKTVKALKISKGALVMAPSDSMIDCGICCYDTASIYALVKVGSAKHYIAIEEVPVAKWSIFGKNVEKVSNFLTEMKKGSKVDLESDLYLAADDSEIFFGDDDDSFVSAVTFRASAFGNMTAKNLKGKESSGNYCVKPPVEECVLEFTPKSYSGWFAGNYDTLVNEGQLCFNCECGEYDIFGGTWKAVFQNKTLTQAQLFKLAYGKSVSFDDDDE